MKMKYPSTFAEPALPFYVYKHIHFSPKPQSQF